jgi:hypothetical protein
MRGQRHAPAALYPRKGPGTHCTGGLVGPRAGLDRSGKSRPPPGFDPRTVEPVVSRYTGYVTRPTEDGYCNLRKARNHMQPYANLNLVYPKLKEPLPIPVAVRSKA